MSRPLTVRIGPTARSRREVIAAIARALEAPEWFGHNLDALYDLLTGIAPGPIHLCWEVDAATRAALGEDFERLRRLLLEAAAERDDLVVEICER